jgi:hypothetical protein
MERQLHVFDSLQYGNQVVELKNEADVVGAPMGKLSFRKRGDVDIADTNCAFIDLIDSSN